MERDYWLERWRSGNIGGFHLSEANPRLVEHIELLESGGPRRVLVPLSGKSLDLAYLASRGHEVVGIELSEDAARAFFAERGVVPEVRRDGPFLRLAEPGIALLVGDFFAAEVADLGAFDAAYDRASMIALPPALRDRYVPKLLSLLAPGANLLLVTLDFDAEGGPPFSIGVDEVRTRYAGHEVRELAATEDTAESPKLLQRGATRVLERVFHVRRQG
jgi:thiopurine S-methyltransferase